MLRLEKFINCRNVVGDYLYFSLCYLYFSRCISYSQDNKAQSVLHMAGLSIKSIAIFRLDKLGKIDLGLHGNRLIT